MTERKKKEGLTSVSPSRDDVGDARHRNRPTMPATQKAQTMTQRRDIHGAGSKFKIPIEEELDLRGEKMSLKS